mgnify:CR=1 FL=1
MQINSNNLYNLNFSSSNNSFPVHKTTATHLNEDIAEQNSENIPIDNSYSSFASMSLDEIKSYIEENRIEDDVGSRAKALFDMQKFVNKLEPGTYNRMVNSIMSEKKSSGASMRHATFPSTKMLDENPKMFHAVLETTLSMGNTPHALIFSLDLKRDFSSYSKEQNNLNKNQLDTDIDFSALNLLEFLLRKLEEIEEDSQNGRQINEQVLSDYRLLFENYNSFDEDNIFSKVNMTA